MPQHRPTRKELYGKLKQALAAIDAGREHIVGGLNCRHLQPDKEDLGVDSNDAYKDLVYECIQLAMPDPETCFRQPSPSKAIKHPEINGLPLWAFVVDHPVRKERIYFKYCLKSLREEVHYYHVNCHKDRPR